MSGRKIRTAPSMISSVSLLDEASHTVRLESGSLEDGSRKGKSARPAVAMVAAHASAEPRKDKSARPRNRMAAKAPLSASKGASQSAGCRPAFKSQPRGTRMTVFNIGLEAVSWLGDEIGRASGRERE